MIASSQTLRRIQPIQPFNEREKSHGMTYGLGPAGYDVRIAETFWLWPKQFKLASTIEHFDTPDNMTFKVEDKSTWARRGLSLFNTTGEPGWKGFLTLELVNHSWWPIRFKRGMPIAQIVYHYLDEATDQPYAGKYQGQRSGAQRARFEEV